MGKNIIFYFSGTGNSLVVAKKIQKQLENCELISMGANTEYILENNYDTIGFVYPTYCQGVPLKVGEFIKNTKFNNQKGTYIFAVATCGGSSGIALAQTKTMIEQNGGNLNYGATVKMVPNYVALYDMKKDTSELLAKANKQITAVVNDVKSRNNNEVGKEHAIVKLVYDKIMNGFNVKDENFNISSECTSCGLCEKVCPVGNIKLVDGKPTFKNKCEQCMACVQYCPKQAINYKNKTQKRGRYHNPLVDANALAKCNEQK